MTIFASLKTASFSEISLKKKNTVVNKRAELKPNLEKGQHELM